MNRKNFLTLALMVAATVCQAAEKMVSFSGTDSGFAVIAAGKPADIIVDDSENPAVKIAAATLADDFGRVCGTKAAVKNSAAAGTRMVIAGTIGNAAIKNLLSPAQQQQLAGKWEKYIITTVSRNGRPALLIAGSDRRGAVYGIYELSRQMGVSPWYWWADVPVEHHQDVVVKRGDYTDGEPKVKYRGIFINDEWPCFGNWTHQKFGGFKSGMYRHLFELVLRLKGNFMWPAMWSSAFFDDDKQNGPVADSMGVVMGTSHHEPMQLNQQDWKRRGKGPWNYATNSDVLKDFWRSGIERSKNWEKMVTIGMRGDGDEPMAEGTNVKLMEQIVADQRQIIADVTGQPAEKTPQLWALYKEVLDYYDQGMKVPDDVTLLLCDDNWGNVRRLPALDSKPRKGGYGMYYHFDYVGTPRNSKWINITNTPRAWEQLRLTYAYNVRQLWVVNVGDLKLQEYPIQFFMDLAWNPEAISANDVQKHTDDFYASLFGQAYGSEIGGVMAALGKLNRSVTPESLNASTFSFNYDEWPRMVSKWNAMLSTVERIRTSIKKESLNAYDELVYIPVKACTNLYRLYYAVAMNQRLAKEKNAEANVWASEAERCFTEDSLISRDYHAINGGKWNYFMAQTHIGYKSWNDPKYNIMPKVTLVGNGDPGAAQAEYPVVEEKTGDDRTSYTFAERDKYVAIEAAHTTRRTNGRQASWLEIPGFGKTLSGITTWPQTATPSADMSLEYDVDFADEGNVHVVLMFAPTLNYNSYRGLRYAVSLNGGEERIVNINKNYRGELGQWQKNPIIESRTILRTTKGRSTLRIRCLDPGMVLEKIVINRGGVKPSYLGPTETLSNVSAAVASPRFLPQARNTGAATAYDLQGRPLPAGAAHGLAIKAGRKYVLD